MTPALLAVVFGYAAASKAARFRVWKAALGTYRLGRLESIVAIAVPAAELSVAGLCLAGFPRAGALLALALLLMFSAAIVRTRRKRLPCACFGGRAYRDRSRLLLRNMLLVVLATCALIWPNEPSALPSGRDLAPVALVGAGLLAGIMTLLGTRAALRR